MTTVRGLDVLLVGTFLILFVSTATLGAPSVLAKYLQRYAIAPSKHNYDAHALAALDSAAHLKRNQPNTAKEANEDNPEGTNPCTDYPDHPFPCQGTHECLPISYVCDNNPDCEDSSDEDEKMCTAADRPPVDEIQKILKNAADWFFPAFFNGNEAADDDILNFSKALAVSPTLKKFARNLRLSNDQVYGMKMVLDAVKQNDEEIFMEMGMPPDQWHDIKTMFSKLISTGFDQVY